MIGNVPWIAQTPHNARTGNAIAVNATALRYAPAASRHLGANTKKNGLHRQVDTGTGEELGH